GAPLVGSAPSVPRAPDSVCGAGHPRILSSARPHTSRTRLWAISLRYAPAAIHPCYASVACSGQHAAEERVERLIDTGAGRPLRYPSGVPERSVTPAGSPDGALVDLLGMLAYGELLAFDRMAADA